MTLQQIIVEKTQRIDSVPESLFRGVEKTESQLMREITRLLNSLQLNPDNTIKLTNQNLIKAEEIINQLRNVMFEGEYLKSVKEFADQFDEQAKLTKEVFEKTFKNYSDSELYNSVTLTAKRRAIDQLGNEAITSQFLNPLKQIMQSGVSTNMSMPELIRQLSLEIVGSDQIDGKLLNWTKQTAYDNFAIADREVTKTISEDLDVQYWKYVGGLLPTSRCFCVKRNGKDFSKSQIEYWGRTPGLWAKTGSCKQGGGMIKGTNEGNIWVYLGGYRCNHSLIPIDEDEVSNEVKANKDNQSYIPV